jgi:amino acid permease
MHFAFDYCVKINQILKIYIMDQHIAFFVAVIGVVLVIAWVIISWYNYRLKKRIIDSGPINQDALDFIKKLAGSGNEALKWGCVIFSGGLGLVICSLIPYAYDSALPYGLEAMFIAAGFLVYYVIMRK